MTAPKTAENVCRGTPSQSAHVPYSRVSSTRHSPTSKTTAWITTITLTAAPPVLSPGAPAADPAVMRHHDAVQPDPTVTLQACDAGPGERSGPHPQAPPGVTLPN